MQHVCSRRTDTFAIVKFRKLGQMYTQDWGHCAQSRITALVAVLGPKCTHSHACASHAAAAACRCSLCGVSGLQSLRSYSGTPELPASFPHRRRQRVNDMTMTIPVSVRNSRFTVTVPLARNFIHIFVESDSHNDQ